MKLRQKLAVALASAMVVSAVPVVTMAASDNRMAKEVLRVGDEDVLDMATGAAVQIVFKDNWTSVVQDEVFYLELENAEFTADMFSVTALKAVNGATDLPVTITKEGDKMAKVVIKETAAGTIDNTVAYSIPLLVKAKGGDAKVSIVKKGSSSTVTDGSWVFATTGEKAASYKIGDLPSFYLKGELAPITLTETFKGSFKKGASFVVELQDGDWEFTGADKGKTFTVDAETSYGFGKGKVAVTVTVNKDDTGSIQVDVPAITSSDSLGEIKITGLAIASKVKDPEEGKLLADIKNVSDKGELADVKDNVEVASIMKYGTYIKMKDEKAVKIEAGHTEEVIFEIGELVDDSMVGAREIEITLDNEDVHFADGSISIDDERKKDSVAQVVESIRYEYVDNDKHEKGIKTIIVELKSGVQVNKEKDWFKLKTKVCVPVNQKDAEDINIKAVGRALENEVTTKAVEIENPFDVTTEEIRVKVGLQNQVGGKIVLKETDKAKFNKGDILLKVADGAPSGIKLESVGTLTVDGDLKKADLKDDKKDEKTVRINLARQSKAASTLTISDLKVTVDRTVPEGKYDLVISGSSVDGHDHSITVKDFFVVGTPNTEDIAANGLRRGTTTFTIGEAKYTANGVSYDMSAASYIQDPGYTMVPVRYVAEAFGVGATDILFSAGTATFFAGERTIQLTNGSDIAVVNGAQIKMATKVVIKDGRTYAPVGEIAKILGISSSWDSTTKTATFTNN